MADVSTLGWSSSNMASLLVGSDSLYIVSSTNTVGPWACILLDLFSWEFDPD